MKFAPIRDAVTDRATGLASQIWTLWLQNLVNLINKFITEEDIEITDTTKGVILVSPDATRWRVTVSNAGALVVTSL